LRFINKSFDDTQTFSIQLFQQRNKTWVRDHITWSAPKSRHQRRWQGRGIAATADAHGSGGKGKPLFAAGSGGVAPPQQTPTAAAAAAEVRFTES
jgi:hypothetical protein